MYVVPTQDSSRVGPDEWVALAKLLDSNRRNYDAFVVAHGTDTMAYTASALSLMLAGFGKPIVLTGARRRAPFICRVDLAPNQVLFGQVSASGNTQ